MDIVWELDLRFHLAIQHPNLCKGLVLESGHFGISTEMERQSRQSLDAQRADEIMADYSSFYDIGKI